MNNNLTTKILLKELNHYLSKIKDQYKYDTLMQSPVKIWTLLDTLDKDNDPDWFNLNLIYTYHEDKVVLATGNTLLPPVTLEKFLKDLNEISEEDKQKPITINYMNRTYFASALEVDEDGLKIFNHKVNTISEFFNIEYLLLNKNEEVMQFEDEVKEYTRLSVELTKAKAKVMHLEAKRNAIENTWRANFIKQNNGEK